MSNEWLGLTETAEILGVHPNTLRSWADLGQLPVHRTEGGHRRFRKEDIEIWLQSQQSSNTEEANSVIQDALKHTRFQINEGELENEKWYQMLDARRREKFRLSGREILIGLRTYLTSEDPETKEEAHQIGADYAYWALSSGLSSLDATRAFLFFRGLLLESVLRVYEHVAIRSPHAWTDMFQKINEFTDLALMSLLDNFEDFQQRGLK